MKVALEFCKGGNAGSAIYLTRTDITGRGSGHRIAGAKCWGPIGTVKAFELTESDLESLIKESKDTLKELKKFNRKKKACT